MLHGSAEPYKPRVTVAWQTFLGAGDLSPTEQEWVQSPVLRSWQRCSLRLDPLAVPRPTVLKGEALERNQLAHFDLIAIARPSMEDIHQFVEGSGFVILLADRVGCILDLLGDPLMVEAAQQVSLQVGAYWSEGSVGTNALALALQEAVPIQTAGAEHFLHHLHTLSTSAAPIHDANGRIVGVLAMVGPAAGQHPHTLATVMAAARAINNQLQTDLYLRMANDRLAEVNGVFSAISEGLMAWDCDGTLTHLNQQAATLLRLAPRAALGRSRHDLLVLPATLEEAIQQGEPLHDVEATLDVASHRVSCLISLQPIFDGLRGSMGFIATLRPIEQVHRLVNQLTGAKATLTLDDSLGHSAPMRRVRRQARVAARGTAPVLLRGEEGVGKDSLAQAIHNESARAAGPFITVNCTVIPRELMASELLGHERVGRGDPHAPGRPSKFELAEGGTLLLDEIERLTLETQRILLSILRSGTVLRVGGTRPIPVNVRVVAATSTHLERLVAEGTFRADLFQRFAVFIIDLPPLRHRTEDIPLLADHLLRDLNRHFSHPLRLDSEALDCLMTYPWPGNTWELSAALERAASLSEDGMIRLRDLPPTVRRGRVLPPGLADAQPLLSLQEAERDAILRAGWACQGRVAAMAKLLGTSRTTLWRRMKSLKIDPNHFKES